MEREATQNIHDNDESWPWDPGLFPQSVDDSFFRRDISLVETIFNGMRLSSKTAPGSDNIPNEIWKWCPHVVFQLISVIFNICWNNGKIPDLWKVGITVILPKTANPQTTGDWRPITMQNTLYKWFISIVNKRLLKFCLKNKLISDDQLGFLPIEGCREHVTVVKNVLQNAKQYNSKMYMLFIDFKAAYPSVAHKRLRQVAHNMKLPKKFKDLLLNKFQNSRFKLKVGNSISRDIPLTTIICKVNLVYLLSFGYEQLI